MVAQINERMHRGYRSLYPYTAAYFGGQDTEASLQAYTPFAMETTISFANKANNNETLRTFSCSASSERCEKDIRGRATRIYHRLQFLPSYLSCFPVFLCGQ